VILVLEMKKKLESRRENTADEESQSSDFSRNNHESTATNAPERCYFSSTFQAFSSSHFL